MIVADVDRRLLSASLAIIVKRYQSRLPHVHHFAGVWVKYRAALMIALPPYSLEDVIKLLLNILTEPADSGFADIGLSRDDFLTPDHEGQLGNSALSSQCRSIRVSVACFLLDSTECRRAGRCGAVPSASPE